MPNDMPEFSKRQTRDRVDNSKMKVAAITRSIRYIISRLI